MKNRKEKSYPRFFKNSYWSSDTRFLRIEKGGAAYYVFSDGKTGESGYSEEEWEIEKGHKRVIEITEAEAALL